MSLRFKLAAISSATLLTAGLGLMTLGQASAAVAPHANGVAHPAAQAGPDFSKGATYYIYVLHSGDDYSLHYSKAGANLSVSTTDPSYMVVDSDAKTVGSDGFYMWELETKLGVSTSQCMEFDSKNGDVHAADCSSSVAAQWWWLDGSVSGGGLIYSLYQFTSGHYHVLYFDAYKNGEPVTCSTSANRTWDFVSE